MQEHLYSTVEKQGLLSIVNQTAEQLQEPPLLITTEKLWSAYSCITPEKTKG
jgi:hypothetical protein